MTAKLKGLAIALQACGLICALMGLLTNVTKHPVQKVNWWTAAYVLANLADLIRAI